MYFLIKLRYWIRACGTGKDEGEVEDEIEVEGAACLSALMTEGVVLAEHNGERPECAVAEVEAVRRCDDPLRRDQRAAAEHLSSVLLHERCLQAHT